MKLYLDTNIFRQVFFNIYETVARGEPFNEPKLFRFFRENQDKLVCFTSCLSRAEIYRQLKSDLNLGEKDIEEFWKIFITLLPVNEIEEFLITNEIADISKAVPLKKKTLINIIHLLIAKKTELVFITGDKQLVKNAKLIYPKICSYSEFREKFEMGSL